ERDNLPGPPLRVEPGAFVKAPSVPPTPVVPALFSTLLAPGSTAQLRIPARSHALGQSPGASSTFTFYRAAAQGPYPTGTAAVTETHAGAAGPVVFMSGNWFPSYSTDNGANFSFVNPYTQFPSLDSGFCCDQTVIY